MNQMIPTALNFVQTQVHEPCENDVLFGVNIAKVAANHSGNLILRDLVESCLDEYKEAKTKQQKMKINRHIIGTMKNKHGARFLSKRNNAWVLVDDQTTRDTISRNLRVGAQKKARRNQHIQQARARLAQTNTKQQQQEIGNFDPAMEPADGEYNPQVVQEVYRLQLQILERMMSGRDSPKSFSTDDEDEHSSAWFRYSTCDCVLYYIFLLCKHVIAQFFFKPIFYIPFGFEMSISRIG